MVAESATPLSTSGRIVLLIEPCHAVAKVGPRSQLSRFATEVDLARYIQRRRGPVVPALLRANPGPHVHGDSVISFWEHAPSEVGAEQLEIAAVPAYAELRVHLNGFPGALPCFTEPIEACRQVLGRGQLEGLSRAEAGMVGRALEAVHSLEIPEADIRILHGDPHVRNLTQAFGETLWLDLKSACLGPLEWDLAALPPAGHFQPPNPERLSALRAARSASVVVWCLQKRAPRQHEREAIRFHLQQLASAPAV